MTVHHRPTPNATSICRNGAIRAPRACAIALCAGLFALSLATLAGCGAGAQGTVTHQIVQGANACVTCHPSDRAPFADATPANATACNGTVEVTTNSDTVIVCKPLCGKEDGSFCIPERMTSVKVEDGKATVELEEGIWAVCIDKGGSSNGVIVNVTPGAGQAVSATLN